MKRILLILFLLCLVTMGCLSNSEAKSEVKLLMTGDYHGDEVDVKDGEKWYGVYQSKNGFEVKATKIKVSGVEDVVLDEVGEKTGIRVGADEKDEPIFLVKGIVAIKEGGVKTVFSGRYMLYPSDYEIFFDGSLDGRYSIKVSGKKEESEEGAPFYNLVEDYKIDLSYDGITQRIEDREIMGDASIPFIRWVGDLDGDGKLDMLMDLTHHYNVTCYKLFLSSYAKEGEIVKEVAELYTVGC